MRDQPPTVLPRRVVPQPAIELVAGGDCGACVLAGLLGLEVAEAYDRLRGKRVALSPSEMRDALYAAYHEGLLDRVVRDTPVWPYVSYPTHLEYGLPAHEQALPWFHHARMAFDAGYYGVACVQLAAQGGPTDHWVLLCGARERTVWNDAAHTSGQIQTEVLVSCSARTTPEEAWVDAHDFLRHRGGYNLLLARPAG